MANLAVAQRDSTYIHDYRDYGNLSLALESKANTILVVGPQGELMRLRTNNGFPTYGVMFSYKYLNLWFTTSAGALSPSRGSRGQTNNLGFAVGYTGNRWWLRAFFEDYKGFYVTNPEVFAPDWFDTRSNFPLLPELRTFTVYGTAYYGFNKDNYSHRAMLWQSEKQKKSAGSWLMGISAGYDHVYSDSVIIPFEARPTFSNLADISSYRTFTGAVNVGYTHTFVLSDRWSFGMMFAPGIAGSIGEIETDDETTRRINLELGLMAEGRMLLSYHHDRWFSGVAMNAYMLTKPINGDLFSNLHTYIRFNVGYRLAMPKSRFLRNFGLSD